MAYLKLLLLALALCAGCWGKPDPIPSGGEGEAEDAGAATDAGLDGGVPDGGAKPDGAADAADGPADAPGDGG